jgi:hypothetical protein
MPQISNFVNLGKNGNIREKYPQIHGKNRVEIIQDCLRSLMGSICRVVEVSLTWKVECSFFYGQCRMRFIEIQYKLKSQER